MNNRPLCCTECEQRHVTYTVRRDGELVVIDHVPAMVCPICGDALLAPQTVRGIEDILKMRPAPAQIAPVYEYAGQPTSS
jgi:YgiT-type zinc finger domain-containing protein